MTHIDEAPDSPSGRSVMTVGTSVAGEILAGRYQLEEHINNDANGRQVWRGIDVVLRRPVAIVLRHPGGATAVEMISAAVAASRITHPHLVDVYDAFDEGTRAYVVREWVDGSSLRELVAEAPLDASRATSVAHAVASAIAAAHATQMVHGNVHPGTVLIGDDGRVVLADARADESITPEHDVRAVGAILYCALTGYWPHAEVGTDRLADGVRDATGALASPRQVRGGLPSYLSELATDLLDPNIAPPTAESLSVELGRLDTDSNDEFFGDSGPLGFTSPARAQGAEPTSRAGRKLAIGVVALIVIAAGGLLIASKLSGNASAQTPGGRGSASPNATTSATTPPGRPTVIALTPGQVRVVDPPKGDRTELDGVGAAVDGDQSTGWRTQEYNSAQFGRLKPGMGILIDLGKQTDVTTVRVDFAAPGSTVEIRLGNTDPGATSQGDSTISKTYRAIGSPQTAGSTAVLPVGTSTRYLLVWITSLPPAGSRYPGKFGTTIEEITVFRQ